MYIKNHYPKKNNQTICHPELVSGSHQSNTRNKTVYKKENTTQTVTARNKAVSKKKTHKPRQFECF